MIPGRPLVWTDYRVGMTHAEILESGLLLVRREWDLDSEKFIGLTFSQFIPQLIAQSRFHPTRFNTPSWIGKEYQGGIIQVNFKIYEPNPHEFPGQIRQTGGGRKDYWLPVNVRPDGEMDRYTNPLNDPQMKEKGLAIGFSSMVILNNLTSPGSYGGAGHFPLLDIVHSPTPENVQQLISEIKLRCGLEKFFVLRSSNKGMMIVGPELVDEENYVSFLFDSLLLNHMEVAGEFWIDDRWIARSTQNLNAASGNRINQWRYSGILRVNSIPPEKPEEPTIIAASF